MCDLEKVSRGKIESCVMSWNLFIYNDKQGRTGFVPPFFLFSILCYCFAPPPCPCSICCCRAIIYKKEVLEIEDIEGQRVKKWEGTMRGKKMDVTHLALFVLYFLF